MSRNILYRWLPAAILLVCLAVLLPRLMQQSTPIHSDSDAPVISSPAEVKGWSDVAVKDSQLSDSPFLDQDAAEAATDDELVSESEDSAVATKQLFDRQRWENSGETLEERARNYLRNRPLPKMEKPLYVEPVMQTVTLRQKMDDMRAAALATNSSGAWAHLKFTPEMIGEQVTGLRLTDAQAADFLAMHDLEDGDIIKQVNGKELNTYESAFESISVIGQSEQLQLVIDRGGEMINVDIDKSETEFTNEESTNE